MQYRDFFKRGRRVSNTLLLSFIGLAIASLAFLFTRKKGASKIQKQILDILTSGGVSKREALYWVAVSMVETTDFTDPIFVLGNNCFGMKVARNRETTRSGTITSQTETDPDKTFSSYLSVADSVRDLMLYMDATNYPTDFPTLDQFIFFMKGKGYFTMDTAKYLAKARGKLSQLL